MLWQGTGNVMSNVMSTGSVRAGALKPLVLVSLLIVLAIAGTTLPSLVGYSAYGQQAIDQQIDREDGALCEKFGFAPGAGQNGKCKADLADLRRRHELLLMH
jgi:hypothetical protein